MSAQKRTVTVPWLIFFYSAPSRPVSKRMKVWRKLLQEGALHFKGAVYLLPWSESREEMLTTLVSDVIAMGGDAAFVKAAQMETIGNDDIVPLFNAERCRSYEDTGKRLHALEQKLAGIQKGGKVITPELLLTEFRRIEKAVNDIAAIDFFGSEQGSAYEARLKALAEKLDETSHGKAPADSPGIELRNPADYQRRLWVTRTKPFVDRMASAWLIRRFIDSEARFSFIADEKKPPPPGSVLFDMSGGEFTHHNDLCTFEVLMKSFGLKQRPLRKIAGIVHELDIKDGRCKVPEASGIEELLTGIRKTARSDAEALEKGMAIFELLYASKA
ncbi:MAG: hypothetical protein FD164_968 [Nitrospirae bacterium]|nr:MAG: hypothetical protein FD164_968 [Nitrospirota bacterium]